MSKDIRAVPGLPPSAKKTKKNQQGKSTEARGRSATHSSLRMPDMHRADKVGQNKIDIESKVENIEIDVEDSMADVDMQGASDDSLDFPLSSQLDFRIAQVDIEDSHK